MSAASELERLDHTLEDLDDTNLDEPCPACGGRRVDGGPDRFGMYDCCDACEGTGLRDGGSLL